MFGICGWDCGCDGGGGGGGGIGKGLSLGLVGKRRGCHLKCKTPYKKIALLVLCLRNLGSIKKKRYMEKYYLSNVFTSQVIRQFQGNHQGSFGVVENLAYVQ